MARTPRAYTSAVGALGPITAVTIPKFASTRDPGTTPPRAVEREAKAIKKVKAAQAEAAKSKREAKAEVQETKKQREAVGVERRKWQAHGMEFKDKEEELIRLRGNTQVRTDTKEALLVSALEGVEVAQQKQLYAEKNAARRKKQMDSQQRRAQRDQARTQEVVARQTNVIKAQGSVIHEQKQVLVHAKMDVKKKDLQKHTSTRRRGQQFVTAYLSLTITFR